ncbi:hypothetical protein ACFFSY_12230 [Paenibacillus aurantiacus]|uniref:Acyltransferase n=1 Tax=Paenibacillus aurantiacus TaxID=1936118 RepID=A0ABV5KQM6_9BACL
MRRYYPGITLFKLAGCLLVLFSHVLLIRYADAAANQQLRFVALPFSVIVPCFYMVAGFLAYKGWLKAASPIRYVSRYVVRIGLLYAAFCAMFAAEHILPALMGGGLSTANLILQAKIMLAAVFLNGPSVQLWFIPPLLFSVPAACWLMERRRIRLAILLASAGFAAALLAAGSLRPLLLAIAGEQVWPYGSLGAYGELLIYRYFGFGFFFVLAGMLAAKYEETFYRMRLLPLLAAAIVLTAAESMLLLGLADYSHEYRLTLSVIPNTLLLFYGLLHAKSRSVQAWHPWINLFSIVTFVGHILFMRLNLLVTGWDLGHMNGLQDAIFVLLALAECLTVTVLLRGLGRIRQPSRSSTAEQL